MLKQLVGGSSAVALGTALGQGAVLAATPWLARSYSPADFGALALITSVSNIAMAVGCLRYDLALSGARADDARPLLAVSLFASLSIGILAFVISLTVLFVTGNSLPSPFNSPYLLAVCVLFAGLHQAALGWSTRLSRFSWIGAIRFGQGASFVMLSSISAIGLAWAHALSFLAALPALIAEGRNKDSSKISKWKVAAHYCQFPMVSLPGAILDIAGYSLCIWIVAANFGAADAGRYSLVQRIVGAPLMLLGISIGQVLLRRSADLISAPDSLKSLFSQVLKLMAILALSVVTLVAAFGEPVLSRLLGSQWLIDTSFITAITLAVAIRACVSPLSTLLITLRRFDLALCWQAVYFVSASLTFWFASLHLELDDFVLVYAVHECVLYSAYLLLIRSAIQSSCAASSA